MRNLVVVVAVALSVVPLRGQNWAVPRTPWGDPDLQGLWPSVEMLGVPLLRPADLGEKGTLTNEEFARLPAQRRRAPNEDDAINFGESTAHWREFGKPQQQTSLIVDPPNGRFPAPTPDGATRLAARPSESRGPLTGPENASQLSRCLSRGPLGSMLPTGSNNGNQIIQAPGLVVIRNEMVHEARVIPVGERPHVGAGVRSYMGDSRGRWEGNTLVVETTNFNGKDGFFMLSEDARLRERFTRSDDKTLLYEATVDDPRTFTRSWTIAFP